MRTNPSAHRHCLSLPGIVTALQRKVQKPSLKTKRNLKISLCVTPTHTAAAAPSPLLLLHSHSVSVSISFSISISFSFLLTCLRFGSAGKSPAFPKVFSLLPESFLMHRHFVIQQPQSWDEITPEPPPAYSKSRPAQPQTCLGTIIVFFPIRNGFFEHASVVCLPSASIFISNSLRVAPRSE